MQKYFDLLLELLRPENDDFVIDEKRKLSAVWEKIENRWDRNLRVAHKYSFLFNAYDDLINDRISLDEFLATWDITSKRKLEMNNESSIDVVNSIIKWNIRKSDNTLFILDSISLLSLSDSDKKIVQNRAKDHSCEIIFC